MNFTDQITNVLAKRGWNLIDQAEPPVWSAFVGEATALAGQIDATQPVDQTRLDRAVIAAYCPILYDACKEDGSQRQQRAFEELWRWVYPRVYQRVDSAENAEDVSQEVMRKVYENLHQVTDPRGFLAWVNKITFRTLADYYRRKGRRDQVEQFIFDVESNSGTLDELAVAGEPLEMELSLAEEELVHMIYECMPKRTRRRVAVFVALVFGEVAVQEVAARMQTTPSNIHLLYFRAREDLLEHCRHLIETLLQYLAPSRRAEHLEADPCSQAA